MRDGASQNSKIAKDMLGDLKKRGFALFVLDGSKALGKGVRVAETYLLTCCMDPPPVGG